MWLTRKLGHHFRFSSRLLLFVQQNRGAGAITIHHSLYYILPTFYFIYFLFRFIFLKKFVLFTFSMFLYYFVGLSLLWCKLFGPSKAVRVHNAHTELYSSLCSDAFMFYFLKSSFLTYISVYFVYDF